MPRARSVAITIMLALTLLTGSAAALNGGVGVDGEITVNATDGPAVSLTSTSGDEMVFDGPQDANTVKINHTDGEAVFSSPSPTSVSVNADGLTGTHTNLTAISASSNLTIDPTDKSATTISGGISQFAFSDVAIDDNSPEFTYTASASSTVTLRGLQSSSEYGLITADGSRFDSGTTSSSGHATVTIPADTDTTVYLVTPRSPQLDNAAADPQGGTVVNSYDVNLTIPIKDADFDTSDEVTVTWYLDGSQEATTTITQNTTASYQTQITTGGSHTWSVEVTDAFGQTASSQTFDFATPAELSVYYETRPSKLIDESGTELTARFFQINSSTVVTREVRDGTVSLTGLPVDQRFVVTVRSNNTDFTYRRIVINSLTETQQIYLLQDTEPNSQLVFDLDDPTGQFPPRQTLLFIEKPISKDYDGDGSNETRYQTIAGDSFGASGDFPAVLQRSARYRLRVESTNSDESRILGAYSVAGSTRVPIQISEIAPRGSADAGSLVYGSISDRTLSVSYRDQEGLTDSVSYEVQYPNGTTFVPTTTRSARFTDTYILPPNATGDFNVTYTVDRGGSTNSGSFVLSRVAEIADRTGFHPDLMVVLSLVLIIAVGGLTVILSPDIMPAASTMTAVILNLLGFIAIPDPFLGIAGAISVLLLLGRRGL